MTSEFYIPVLVATAALLASRLRGFVTRPRVHTWLQRGSGAVLIGLAALTATLRRA